MGAILLLAVAAGTAQAQEFRGRVQGIVTDATGAIVPGVGVVLRNDNTGVEASRTTNKDGWYLFDYVDPGTYTLTAALSGFKAEIRKNIRVQQRADLTVDFKLEVGSLVETVTVTEAPLGLQFTTATRDLTVEQEMVKELPSSTRNPFQLAMLDPMTVNRGSTVETQPYHHRTANEMDIGGGTKYRNDVLLDGTPLTAGNKLGYTPPMDSVTEYTVLQNAIDAEFGHNSGGVAVVTMKSGTNDVHATAYYYGRDASLNAISDRAIQKHSDNPYWNAGATLGLPIIKNKLFLFAVFEKIENTQSSAGYYTLPTALERQGDFSQSKNADGTLRMIYDPKTSRYGPNGELIRDQFPDNKIPSDRWDPLAAKIMNGLWDPNNAGDDQSGFNNFKYQQELKFHYYNFSTRLDWNINDRWKAYARVSRMVTNQDGNDYTNGDDPLKLRNITGSKRNGWNIAADTVYTFNPTTTLNLRGSFYQAEDKRDYPDMAIGDGGHAEPVAERLVAAVRHGPTAHLLALHRRRQHVPRAVRRPELLVPGAPRLQRARAPQQVPHPPHAEGRRGDPLEARRGRALLLHAVPVRPAGDRQRLDEPGHQDRQPVGELPARRDGQRDALLGRGRQLARPVHAVPDRQHGDVRLLPPGRLQGHP